MVWDDKDQVWRCCGTDQSGRPACDEAATDMSGVNFLAPAPDVLLKDRSDETVNGVRLGTATVTYTSLAATATGEGSAHHGGSGLSSYAIAGIAVGVIVPVVLIGVVGFFLMQRRRASKRREGIEMTSMQHWHR